MHADRLSVLPVAAALLLASTAHAAKKDEGSGTAGGDHAQATFDTNGDQAPDVWEYYPRAGGGSGNQPVRREIDLNHDGKKDVVSHFSAGQLVREEMDADFDGRIDWVDIYENGQRVRSEWDTGFDGKPDLFKYWEGGALVRVEQDTDGDGRPDYFEYYAGGELERFGRDTDGDGQVDQWGGRRPGQ